MNDSVIWIDDFLAGAAFWAGLGVVVYGAFLAVQCSFRNHDGLVAAVSGGITGLMGGPLFAALVALLVSVGPGSPFEAGRSVGRYIAGNTPWIDWVIAAGVGWWVVGVIFTVLAVVRSSRQHGDRQ